MTESIKKWVLKPYFGLGSRVKRPGIPRIGDRFSPFTGRTSTRIFMLSRFKPAGGLKEGVGQVESKGRAISLLADFEIVEEPTDVGKEEIADLGLLVKRGI